MANTTANPDRCHIDLASVGEVKKKPDCLEWSRTPLGSFSQWPDSLKSAFSIALHANEPVCIVWGQDLICLFNDAFRSLLDRRHVRPGQPLDKLMAPVWPLLSKTVIHALETGSETKASPLSLSALRPGKNEEVTYDFCCVPIKSGKHQVRGLYCTFRPSHHTVSLPDTAAGSTKPADPPYGDILDAVPIGVIQIAVDKEILYANHAVRDMLGYTHEPFPVSFNELLHPSVRDKTETVKTWKNIWHTTTRFCIELLLRHQNGTYLLTENEIILKLDRERQPAYAILMTQATGQEKTSGGPHISLFDPLTSLPNRNYADSLIGNALLRAEKSGQTVALLLLDINRFKVVNESLGHELGDELLKSIATRLIGRLRQQDSVIRMGNDEFVIVLENIKCDEDVSQIVQHLLDAVSQPLKLGSHEITPSVSIGCSLYPKDSDDMDTLLKYADIAMLDAKKTGSNLFRFFNRDMNITVLDQLLVETSLSRAMEKQEFRVYYQPRLCLKTGTIVGLEALIRWNHPKKGLIPAGEFIGLAEKIGLIHRIGEFVLASVTRQLTTWRDHNREPVPVAINLSAKELYERELKHTLSGVFHNTGLSPDLFELEITESNLIENLDKAKNVLSEIREMGVTISIDDFGTGYSSLSYLSALPIDYLKIDSSFIADVVQNRNTASIVETTITLAHSLGMRVIAEGVETARQLRFLTELGCDQIQGYLCSSALSAAELENFIRHFRAENIGLIV